MNKVTIEQIIETIEEERTFTMGEAFPDCTPEIAKITLCVLVLKGGFTILGKNMGPVLPSEHNAEMGVKMARADAIEQVWPLLGYQLHLEKGGDWRFRLQNEIAALDKKIAALRAGLHKAPVETHKALEAQLATMVTLSEQLKARDK